MFTAMKRSEHIKALVCKNLKKSYNGVSRPALNGLSLSIDQGTIYGLLGPNGAGKTTSISILSTLISPDKGRLKIYGINALRYPNKVKRLIGLVPQDIALYPSLTARENMLYFGRIYGLKGKELNHEVGKSLELVGLQDSSDRKISTYSGGMKRRANLAVGILHKPRLLFLDEPTVGIDAQSRNMIMEKLVELKEKGTTIIYTTHYMEEAEKLCEKIEILDEGVVLAKGSPRELMTQAPGINDLNDLFLSLTGKNLRD